MIKEAFKRLEGSRKAAIFARAMALYSTESFESITIRRLTRELGINMATFYRWFDDKDDLPLEIARSITEKVVPEDGRHVFETFTSTSQLSHQEVEFMTGTLAWSDKARQRLFFEVNVSTYMPIIKQYLQLERLNGHLRDNVSDEFVAFLYVTLEYNLLCFTQMQGIHDKELYSKLKDYLLHSLLPHGIMKDAVSTETRNESGE